MIVGQQNSHITITEVDGGLRFEDPGTETWRDLPELVRQAVGRQGRRRRLQHPRCLQR